MVLAAYIAHQRAHGRCWGGQALQAIPDCDTVPLRGQRLEHGWQNPPDALLSGWY